MSKANDSIPEKFMDLRLRDKLLGEGKITKAQVDQYLESLPDDTEGVEYVELMEGQDGNRSKSTGQQK